MVRWDAAHLPGPTILSISVHPCPATSSTGSGSFNSLTSSQQSQSEQAIIELLNILIPRTSHLTKPPTIHTTEAALAQLSVPAPRLLSSRCGWERISQKTPIKVYFNTWSCQTTSLPRKVYQDVHHYCWANILYLMQIQIKPGIPMSYTIIIYSHPCSVLINTHRGGDISINEFIYTLAAHYTQSNIFHPGDMKYFLYLKLTNIFSSSQSRWQQLGSSGKISGQLGGQQISKPGTDKRTNCEQSLSESFRTN